jgi:hypothetical protein
MIRRLALGAALAGSAIGATVVLADDQAPPRRPVPVVASGAAQAQPTPTPMPARDPRIVLQTGDWAIRHFTAPVPKPQGRHTTKDPATQLDCYELGRVQGERFGWVDGHGAFKPAAPGHYSVPNVCVTPRSLRKAHAQIGRLTTVTFPANGTPQPDRTVSWGIAEPGVTAFVPDGEAAVAVKDQLALQIGPANLARISTGHYEHADGSRTPFDYGSLPRYRGQQPVAGTTHVAVKTLDPAGGEPWALLVTRGDAGGVCLGGPGRLVGDSLGYVDRALDTFSPSFIDNLGNCSRPAPTLGHPLRMDTLVSSGFQEEDEGRVQRRVIDGRIVYFGLAHPDVVSVTLTTPRDVRTLVPTPDHTILAVYAGLFPGGQATATAHLKDGREVTQALHVE